MTGLDPGPADADDQNMTAGPQDSFTVGYGPPPSSPRGRSVPEPVFLPVRPRQGWAAADRARRRFAVLWLVMAVGWAAVGLFLPLSSVPAEILLFATMVLGPPACFSAARVLRPYPVGTGAAGERGTRHWFAAVGSAYSFPFFLAGWLTPSGAVSFDGGGFYILYLLIAAFFAGVVSLVWGVAAGSARAVRRRRANG